MKSPHGRSALMHAYVYNILYMKKMQQKYFCPDFQKHNVIFTTFSGELLTALSQLKGCRGDWCSHARWPRCVRAADL